jgi:acyl-coenzyme A thioesterase PaaI-like protein
LSSGANSPKNFSSRTDPSPVAFSQRRFPESRRARIAKVLNKPEGFAQVGFSLIFAKQLSGLQSSYVNNILRRTMMPKHKMKAVIILPDTGYSIAEDGQMRDKAFQDYYEDRMSHCYGCGRLNRHGLQIKSYWDKGESVCRFQPKPYHTAFPGYVYGGLIASLIDCHGTGTAAAAAHHAENRSMDTEPRLRFITASLHVDYLRPTPMGATLEVRGKVKEIKGRKVVVETTLSAGEQVCARGEVVAVQVPEYLVSDNT